MTPFTALLGYTGRRTLDGRMFLDGALSDTRGVEVWAREHVALGQPAALVYAGICDVHVEGDEIRATGEYHAGVLQRCDPLPGVPHGWWATFSVDRVHDAEDDLDPAAFLVSGLSVPVASARLRSITLQASAHGVCWEGEDVGLLTAPEAAS